VFPDRETMNAEFSDYSFRTLFAPVSRSSLENPTIDIDRYLLWSPTDSVVFCTTNDSKLALRYGLSCWVFHLWCEEHEIDTARIPRLIIEGFANYCAHSLTGDDPWRVIASQWATEGNLTDVPPSLLHEVGASFISWYMRGIREIISRYGELPYHWRSMRIDQYWFNRASS